MYSSMVWAGVHQFDFAIIAVCVVWVFIATEASSIPAAYLTCVTRGQTDTFNFECCDLIYLLPRYHQMQKQIKQIRPICSHAAVLCLHKYKWDQRIHVHIHVCTQKYAFAITTASIHLTKAKSRPCMVVTKRMCTHACAHRRMRYFPQIYQGVSADSPTTAFSSTSSKGSDLDDDHTLNDDGPDSAGSGYNPPELAP